MKPLGSYSENHGNPFGPWNALKRLDTHWSTSEAPVEIVLILICSLWSFLNPKFLWNSFETRVRASEDTTPPPTPLRCSEIPRNVLKRPSYPFEIYLRAYEVLQTLLKSSQSSWNSLKPPLRSLLKSFESLLRPLTSLKTNWLNLNVSTHAPPITLGTWNLLDNESIYDVQL